jgi:hypothetical protein
MNLIIPESVGGTAKFTAPPQKAVPVEEIASQLVIPASVGGPAESEQQAIAATDNQPTSEPVNPALDNAPSGGRFSNSGPSFNNAMQPEQTLVDDSDNRETRATRELPEFVRSGILNGESLADITKISTAAAVTMNPRELGAIITNLLPHIGITEDEKGNILASNNKSGVQSVINPPGVSAIDLAQTGAAVAAFSPAASLASIPAKIGVKAAVGATGSGLTQTAIEGLQSQLGGEFNESEIAIATSLGGVAELVIPAIQGIRQARQSGELGATARELQEVAPSIATANEAVDATGVPLFQAQKTLVASQLEKQSFIASLPAGTLKASKELKAQNAAAGKAVDDFLGLIAPPESVVTGSEAFRTAAQRAIARAKEIRAEKSSPLFNDAFDEGLTLDTSGIVASLKTTIDDFPEQGEVAKTLSKVSKMLAPKVEGEQLSLRQLQNIKVEIDQMISKVGEGSLGNTTKANLIKVKNNLLDSMDQVSPKFKEARETFARDSAPIGVLEDSIIGKIANIKDVELKSISSKIFNPAETNPAVVAKAKTIIADVDPDAWNQLLRVELERRLGSIKPTEGETLQNIPGQLYRAIFGNEKQSQVLYRALNAEQSKNLKYIQTALGRARIGRPGGSQTAAREEIKKDLGGGAVKSIREFLSNPINTVTGIGDDAAFNSRVSAMAEVMYNPKWSPRMANIRQLNSNSPAAARAMTQLLDDITLEQQEDN